MKLFGGLILQGFEKHEVFYRVAKLNRVSHFLWAEQHNPKEVYDTLSEMMGWWGT